VAGLALVASFVGLFLGYLAQALSLLPSYNVVMRACIVAFAIWLVLASLGVVPRWHIGPWRQTHPLWRWRFGPTLAALLWGLDLGSGFTTQSTHPSFWLLPMAVLVQADPILGMFTYLAFNLVRAAPVLVGPLLPGDPVSWLGTLGRLDRSLELVAALIAIWAIVLMSNG
jgi:hypothetical protein